MRFVLVPAIVMVCLLGAQVTTRVRQPSAAGTLYPADREALRAAVQRYLGEADVMVPPGRIVACIAPHDGYGLSGEVAAHAFKPLQTGQYSRIIVLSPSHYAAFRGCSIAAVQAYRTPMGEVVIDGPAIQQLTLCTLISRRAVKYEQTAVTDEQSVGKSKQRARKSDQPSRKARQRLFGDKRPPLRFQPPPDRVQIHEMEYGIEVVLPFLQQQVGLFGLVPIVVGECVNDYTGEIDDDAILTIVRELRNVMDDETLIIVSTNLTHYGNAYSYRPFKDNVLENVEALDKQAIRLLLEKDYEGFKAYLKKTENPICGKTALLILLKLLPKETIGHLLDYDISARKTNNLEDAVGYASLVFVDPTRLPAEPHPEAAIPPPVSGPTPPQETGAIPPPSTDARPSPDKPTEEGK
jgi:hypothetical protein